MRQHFNYGIDPLTITKTLAIAAGKIKAVLNEEAVSKNKSQSAIGTENS